MKQSHCAWDGPLALKRDCNALDTIATPYFVANLLVMPILDLLHDACQSLTNFCAIAVAINSEKSVVTCHERPPFLLQSSYIPHSTTAQVQKSLQARETSFLLAPLCRLKGPLSLKGIACRNCHHAGHSCPVGDISRTSSKRYFLAFGCSCNEARTSKCHICFDCFCPCCLSHPLCWIMSMLKWSYVWRRWQNVVPTTHKKSGLCQNGLFSLGKCQLSILGHVLIMLAQQGTTCADWPT